MLVLGLADNHDSGAALVEDGCLLAACGQERLDRVKNSGTFPSSAIDAVLEPADSSYLYFVSKNDGTHHFSRSFREHSNAVRKYQVEYFRRRQRQKNGEGSS